MNCAPLRSGDNGQYLVGHGGAAVVSLGDFVDQADAVWSDGERRREVVLRHAATQISQHDLAVRGPLAF